MKIEKFGVDGNYHGDIELSKMLNYLNDREGEPVYTLVAEGEVFICDQPFTEEDIEASGLNEPENEESMLADIRRQEIEEEIDRLEDLASTELDVQDEY